MKSLVQPSAREDILRQYRYLLMEKDSPIAAERFLAGIKAAIQQIRKRPGIGAPKVLKNRALFGLRSWPVENFAVIRLYYLVSQGQVQIVRVLHGKRDIGSILEGESEE